MCAERTGELHLKAQDLKLTAKEETSHVIPPFVGPAFLAVGVVLMGVAFVSRR